MRPAVDPVYHDGQVLAHLVGQIFVHDAADDGRLGRGIMKLECHGIALQPIGLQRLVHVADDVAALAQLAQGWLHQLAQLPDARRMFGGEAHLFQLARRRRRSVRSNWRRGSSGSWRRSMKCSSASSVIARSMRVKRS